MKKLFDGVFERDRLLLTKSIAPNQSVYGERLVSHDGAEYREWNPYRSKLASAVKKGLKRFPFKRNGNVLYLGAAEGTSISHLSDIVGEKGAVFGVDVSPTVFRKFLHVCAYRENIIPILSDASKPDAFADYLEGFSITAMFQDISQKNQSEIFCQNAERFLEKGTPALIALKAFSISTRDPRRTYERERKTLSKTFDIVQQIDLAPFQKGHALFACEKK